MKRLLITMVLPGLLFLSACEQVAMTGRSQLNFVPDSMVNSMALDQYQAFLKENKLSADAEKTAMVKEVGGNIANAVKAYFQRQGEPELIDDFEWEFNLIESEEKNAWAMPGGKTVVYTGILPIAEDRNGLAVIMSHEIAHAVARHGSERMSQGLLYQFGGMALSQAMQNYPSATQQLFMTSYGLGGQIGVLLPYSRLHEREADQLGLIFMGMAGYDPRTAIDFWTRMSQSREKGMAVPEFLSTHPADENRIENIKDYLPEAMRYYNQAISTKPQ